ncbi:MAG TPA: hypothetical protein VFU63_02115 [Ktedonobacterales bacterium]|nr:hypothetical protein [Ktedonobacterales bacterium]
MTIEDVLSGLVQATIILDGVLWILYFRTARADKSLRQKRLWQSLSIMLIAVVFLVLIGLLGTIGIGSPVASLSLPAILMYLLLAPIYLLGIILFFRAIRRGR